jgi:hypothetical protein
VPLGLGAGVDGRRRGCVPWLAGRGGGRGRWLRGRLRGRPWGRWGERSAATACIMCLLQLLLLLQHLPLSASSQGTAPSPQALQAAIEGAIARRAPRFLVPGGVYNFSSRNLNISGATDLHLSAGNVTLWFAGNAPGPTQPGVNISNCERLHVSGLTIKYYDLVPSRSGHRGITYNLLNCTDVVSEDITIYKAPFFSVTAFNGGGGHVFRRFYMPNDTDVDPSTGRPVDPWAHQRDAFHFTDLRRGVLLEDSVVSGFGDDFFNAHNTIMLVLKRETATSLLMINPHLQNVQKAKGQSIIQNRNTVYGTNCVLQNLRSGDSMHFFGWPTAGCLSRNAGPGKHSAACSREDFTPRAISGPCVVRGAPTAVTEPSILADAAALASHVFANRSTTQFDASDIWRVEFSSALPSAVDRESLVNIDSFSTPGTVIRNNSFSYSKYNLGRFKSNGGVIANNTFAHAGTPNLEISPLLSYFEGNLPLVRDVVVSGNTIVGEGPSPVHCSTMCGRALPEENSTVCPLCSGTNSAFATNVSVHGNHFYPSLTTSSPLPSPAARWNFAASANPLCDIVSGACLSQHNQSDPVVPVAGTGVRFGPMRPQRIFAPRERVPRLTAIQGAQATVSIVAWLRPATNYTRGGFIGGLWDEGDAARQYALYVGPMARCKVPASIVGHISADGGPAADVGHLACESAACGSSSLVATGQERSWHCVSITYDGATIRSFLNGSLDNRPQLKFNNSALNPFRYPNPPVFPIGGIFAPPSGHPAAEFAFGANFINHGHGKVLSSGGFRGTLHGFAVWAQALSPAQIGAACKQMQPS